MKDYSCYELWSPFQGTAMLNVLCFFFLFRRAMLMALKRGLTRQFIVVSLSKCELWYYMMCLYIHILLYTHMGFMFPASIHAYWCLHSTRQVTTVLFLSRHRQTGTSVKMHRRSRQSWYIDRGDGMFRKTGEQSKEPVTRGMCLKVWETKRFQCAHPLFKMYRQQITVISGSNLKAQVSSAQEGFKGSLWKVDSTIYR